MKILFGYENIPVLSIYHFVNISIMKSHKQPNCNHANIFLYLILKLFSMFIPTRFKFSIPKCTLP